jgi:hypothetical protein
VSSPGTCPRGLVCTCGGPEPRPEVRSVYPGVQHFPWGSRPNVDTLEYIVSSGHVVAPEPPTWGGRVLFAARLKIAAWTSCLYTVVRGTPDSWYRQWPPGPPQGRKRACRWGQSLIGDWHAASVCLLTQLLPVRLWSCQLSRLSLWLSDPWSPHLMVLLSHAWGASMPPHWF